MIRRPRSRPRARTSPTARRSRSTEKGSYSKLLPSLNVGWWPRKDILVRAAVAQRHVASSLNQLAPTRTDGTLDRTFEVSYDGNADLEPVEANQADLSRRVVLRRQVRAERCAVFWKDLDGFITTELEENVDIGVVADIGGAGDAPLLYDVFRPINGDSAKVLGFEFGFQHFFDSGFGVRASYTYTDTKSYIDGVQRRPARRASRNPPIPSRSMFENDRWDAQLAADYSGEYVQVTDAVGGLSRVRRPDHLGHGLGRLPADRAVHDFTGRTEPDRRVLHGHHGSAGHARRRRLRDLGPFGAARASPRSSR